MILQSLVEYYEALAGRGKIARPGWTSTKVSYALNLSVEGELLDVFPLKKPEQRGKKEVMVPPIIELPEASKRTVGIAANFLCDNAMYFLGLDAKGNPQRTLDCYEACREMHLALLSPLDNYTARGICAFFEKWRPEEAETNPKLLPFLEDLKGGVNLVFMVNHRFAHEDAAIRQAWQQSYEEPSDEPPLQCLVSGRRGTPAILHPSIKGVRDASTMGASLVSFNARAYESYGRDGGQGRNAPVSTYAAFAYGAALNALLADREHMQIIGDATVVYWSEDAEPAYQGAFRALMGGADDDTGLTNADLSHMMHQIAAWHSVTFDGVELNPEKHFYILGLSPNSARISVRFFYRDSFGHFAENIARHYADMDIVKPQWDRWQSIPLTAMLSETVNPKSKDKKPSPQMAGDTYRAILTGCRYPSGLMNGIALRIRAEREITRGRAAIIKAYLTRNSANQAMKEVLTVQLNDTTAYMPYVLGRIFSLLEQAQQTATPGINAGIKDRYFNSACATPAVVFPLLLKLKNNHLKVISRERPGMAVNLEKELGGLMSRMSSSFPAHLNLEEQGAFILGYYHQTQKRYEKKNAGEEKENA